MCGRFTLTISPEELAAAFPWLTLPPGSYAAPRRYNIAPGQPVAVTVNDGENQLDYFLWGLVPFWSKDPRRGFINARAETLAEKPSFKAAYRYRRCLIFADGFYEWQHLPGEKAKHPYFIRLKGGRTFAFAGLWERWQSPDGSELLTCAIITTRPNEVLRPIHNRMPVILPEGAYTQWLSPGEAAPARLQPLLQPYPPNQMEAYPVSTRVNNPANDAPDCIAPLANAA